MLKPVDINIIPIIKENKTKEKITPEKVQEQPQKTPEEVLQALETYGLTNMASHNGARFSTNKKNEYTIALPDGTKMQWYKNGQKRQETLPDGTEKRWNQDGMLCFERLADGTERKWFRKH